MRIGCNRKLPHNALGWHARLVEMTQHLVRFRFRRSIRRADLDCMILGAVPAHGLYVRRYLAMLELDFHSVPARRVKTDRIAWRTVTGRRSPWSDHKTVMPRFRAMTPVRIEFGDHLGGVAGFADVLALGEARVVREKDIRRTKAASGGLSAAGHILSIKGMGKEQNM